MKKINCKHGLERKQELEARKIRGILIGEVEDKNGIVQSRIKNMYETFEKENESQKKNLYLFYGFIENRDPVLFSAIERVGGFVTFARYAFKNKIV